MLAFTPVGDTLNKKVKQDQSLQSQLDASDVLEVAKKIFTQMFGDDGQTHIKPLFLKNRTLTVTCSSSTLAQEIRLNQATIVEKINQELGKNEVDRIRYLS
jgi:predicted nucleic acid-binding Zn ribbon protein